MFSFESCRRFAKSFKPASRQKIGARAKRRRRGGRGRIFRSRSVDRTLLVVFFNGKLTTQNKVHLCSDLETLESLKMKDHFDNVRQKVGADENVAQQLLFVNSTTLNSN